MNIFYERLDDMLSKQKLWQQWAPKGSTHDLSVSAKNSIPGGVSSNVSGKSAFGPGSLDLSNQNIMLNITSKNITQKYEQFLIRQQGKLQKEKAELEQFFRTLTMNEKAQEARSPKKSGAVSRGAPADTTESDDECSISNSRSPSGRREGEGEE